MIIPTARTSPNMKSERLFTTVMGSSSAAKQVTVQSVIMVIIITTEIQIDSALFAFFGMDFLLLLVFFILFSPFLNLF